MYERVTPDDINQPIAILFSGNKDQKYPPPVPARLIELKNDIGIGVIQYEHLGKRHSKQEIKTFYLFKLPAMTDFRIGDRIKYRYQAKTITGTIAKLNEDNPYGIEYLKIDWDDKSIGIDEIPYYSAEKLNPETNSIELCDIPQDKSSILNPETNSIELCDIPQDKSSILNPSIKLNVWGYQLADNQVMPEKEQTKLEEPIQNDATPKPQQKPRRKREGDVIVNLERRAPNEKKGRKEKGTVTCYEKKGNNYYRFSYYKESRKIHIHLGSTEDSTTVNLVKRIKELQDAETSIDGLISVITCYKYRKRPD